MNRSLAAHWPPARGRWQQRCLRPSIQSRLPTSVSLNRRQRVQRVHNLPRAPRASLHWTHCRTRPGSTPLLAVTTLGRKTLGNLVVIACPKPLTSPVVPPRSALSRLLPPLHFGDVLSYCVPPLSCPSQEGLARRMEPYGTPRSSTPVELPVWTTGFSNHAQ